MTGEFIVYALAAVAIIAVMLGVWLLDARRNKEVEHDDARLDTDNDPGAAGPTPKGRRTRR